MELFTQEIIDCIRFDSGLTIEELQKPWIKEIFECMHDPEGPYVPCSVVHKIPSEDILNKIVFSIARLYKNGTPRTRQFIIEFAGIERAMGNPLTGCIYERAFMLRNSV